MDLEAGTRTGARAGPAARAWEINRYREHRARLAGHPVGETIGRAKVFLAHVHPAVGW